jgi:hypothetical protein
MPDFAMIPRAACWISFGALFAGASLHAERILWSSPPGSTNLTSTEAAMDGEFRFELGVFEGTFDPALEDKTLWAQNWRPAQRTAYNAAGMDFSAEFVVEEYDPPFTLGKQAYIWGFRGDASSGEWILFRDASWTWPVPNPFNPSPPQWTADEATAVILGEINTSGSPFLMKSAAVTNAAPPATTWDQWRQEFLTNEALDGPDDDPDLDGTPNLLEFVFGTDPISANAPTATLASLVDGHLVITIPRRIDHQAVLTVEVSGDLVLWNSGPAHVEILSDGLAALVARDLTPLDPADPKRFIRLKAALPPH